MSKYKNFSFIIAMTLIISINNLLCADSEHHTIETNNEVLIKKKEIEDDDLTDMIYISDIDIEGLKTFNKEYYLQNLPIKAGDSISSSERIAEEIVEGIENLFKIENFTTVEPKIKLTSDNSISVVYKVIETSIVKNIILKGGYNYDRI